METMVVNGVRMLRKLEKDKAKFGDKKGIMLASSEVRWNMMKVVILTQAEYPGRNSSIWDMR